MVGISPSSSLLDTNLHAKEKLYGYHRLEDPPVFLMDGTSFKRFNFSEVKDKIERQVDVLSSPPEAVRS
jgi:hypothetical protein